MEKKKIVITGMTVLRAIAVLLIAVLIVFAIVELIRGTPFIEIFTENLGLWIGGLGALLIFFVVFSSGKKDKP